MWVFLFMSLPGLCRATKPGAAPTPTGSMTPTPTSIVSRATAHADPPAPGPMPDIFSFLIDPPPMMFEAPKGEFVTAKEMAARRDKYYGKLNKKLTPAFGLVSGPTEAEKRWAVMGQAIGISCAAIAAGEALGVFPDGKDRKKKIK